MNTGALRPSNVAAAAVVIGGGLLVLWPTHVMSIGRIVILTVAIAAALHVLATHVPATGWISPFKWMSPFNRRDPKRGRRGPDELELIHSYLTARRQPVEDAPPVPPAVLRILQRLISAKLQVTPRAARAGSARDRERVSPLTWAVLTAEPMRRPTWWSTLAADPDEVARLVRHVLDDLEGPAHRSVVRWAPTPDVGF